MFNSCEEAISWIENIKRKDKRKDLHRIKTLLDILNNPQDEYKKIHIAGTNGKGACAQFTSKILNQKGYTVGRFVSPYILRFNERIVVNDKEINDSELLEISNFLYPIIEEYNNKYDDIVPFFEVVTLIGLLYFKKKNCDFAVIECGLGGLLDATNVINADISIITSIGYDHMKVLGDTLEDISLQKLGIVKENNYLITGVDKSLYEIFDNYCKNKNAYITKVDINDLNIESTFEYTSFILDGIKYKTNLIGSFEALNASLAIKACKYLDNTIDDNIINTSLSNVFWPGRMEILNKNPLIILDGGHNVSAINVVVDSIKKIDKNISFNVIYTGLSDKETDKVINKLSEIAKSFIITTIPDPRAKDPNLLFDEVKMSNKLIIKDPLEAYKYALSLKDNILIIGSLHFVSEIRKLIV